MPRGVPKNGFRMTKKRMSEVVEQATNNDANDKFGINERFEFINDMTMMLVNRQAASMIVSGSGGLGKSYSVIKALSDAGYTDISTVESFEVGTKVDPSKCFRVIKGYSSPKGLFRTLYENREGVIVMDDTDSIFKDATSLNLLKAALDSYSRRIISYRADIRDEDLPQVFEFKGAVIFLTNIPSVMLDQALISRSMVVDLSMTTKQKVERMKHILFTQEFMPEVESNMKLDAITLIENIAERVKDLSLRTLIQVIRIREANPNNNWMRMSEYLLTS